MLRWVSDREIWVVVTVWSNLGECRSPFEKQWQRLTEEPYADDDGVHHRRYRHYHHNEQSCPYLYIRYIYIRRDEARYESFWDGVLFSM